MVDVRGRSVAVVGAGPAGLMAAERLAAAGCAVTVYDRMPSPARKLLMAGRGGLNLTHSEALDVFLARYPHAHERLVAAIRAFPPQHLVAWAEGLNQPTFVGSSGRIFPRALKASPLLRAWLTRLAAAGVELKLNHRWTGWTDTGALSFDASGAAITAAPDATLLAMGGASWPRLGSDAAWVPILTARGVTVTPPQASNNGVTVAWSPQMLQHAGQPLKRVAVAVGAERRRGEVMITRHGLEGGAIYALSPLLRAALAETATADALLDLRPDESVQDIAKRLARDRGKQSASTFLRKQLSLTPPAIAMLNEATKGRLPRDADALATLVKAVPISITGMSSLDRAISTAGGIAWPALDDDMMIRALPGTFAAGEMLDWDAPTGGYLLQACFATAVAAADGILRFLAQPHRLTGQRDAAGEVAD